MSFSRGIQTSSSFLPGSLALPPCTLIMGTTALPIRLVVTVAASITDPPVIVGTKTPSSPSGAAIATSPGVTALRVSFARLTCRTAATFAPLPPVSVRKGITTCCCFSSYRTSFFFKVHHRLMVLEEVHTDEELVSASINDACLHGHHLPVRVPH
ncbi:hypothetical protein PF005_g33585, partial [Phytophthora fragariae]